MTATKDRFIETTSELLEVQGYHATGLKEIVEKSGAPRGSLYYHFPDGKEELAAKAIRQSGEAYARSIAKNLKEGRPIAEAVHDFVLNIADRVEASGFRSGGPLTAIAMETATTNQRLNKACRNAFNQIREAIKKKLVKDGIDTQQAERLSQFITASVEGAIILSRTHHSGDPLRLVASQLRFFLKAFQEENAESTFQRREP